MAEYQYTNMPGKLGEFLAKIRGIGVPPKATTQWLESIGYKSKNDRPFLHVLTFIGFLDSSGNPTDVWINYRGKNHKEVLGTAIRTGYADLYQVYEDAHIRSNEDLQHFFSTKDKSGEQVISRIVSTFKALAAQATFDVSPDQPAAPAESGGKTEPAAKVTSTEASGAGSHGKESGNRTHHPSINPSIHIDLQIHIDPEASPEQIDKIFESMAKHIFNKP